jgi:hypothetical protein
MDAAAILRLVELLLQYYPVIIKAVAGGIALYDAIHQAAPDLIPPLRELATKFLPDIEVDKAFGLVTKRIFIPHAMTREEEELWFKRATGTS